MSEGLIVLKWGGGLITSKAEECTPDFTSIEHLSAVVNDLLSEGFEIILVHGAGSFGHIKAKRYRLAEGDIGVAGQYAAIAEVRKDMQLLNSHVMKNLVGEVHPPHIWAKGVGPEFLGELPLTPPLTVVHGDVCDISGDASFGILSGDELVFRYATELNADRVVFAIRGVDGLLNEPPEKGGQLIESVCGDIDYGGYHNTDIDVTGGILLKVERAQMIAKIGIEVHFVNGDFPERVYAACKGEEVIGTLFVGRNG